MALLLWVGDCLEESGVALWAADVFRRTAAGGFEQVRLRETRHAGIRCSGSAHGAYRASGVNWAIIASLIETAKLNGINPHAWLTKTLTKLVH